MSTPRGCLRVITTALKRLARNGDVERFRAYVCGDAFLAAFNGLDPERRQSALRAYARAEVLCEAKAPHRLIKPKPIDAKRAEKVNWGDLVMRAKLANAYARAGGDNEKAARILGVTVGSARLAKRRHLDAPGTDHRQKAS
jgi:predicted Zn-dependent protease